MAEPEGVWTGYLSAVQKGAFEAIPQIAEPPFWDKQAVATVRPAA